ncbi:unnamed protein product, partial [Closterium sp. NIES-64]
GLSDKILESELSYVPLADRVNAINGLLQKRALQLFKSGDTLLYKHVSQDQAVQFKGLSPEDLLLYQAIKQAGNAGIWTRDMKTRTNLQQPQITKIIKTLEGRKLIKAVKSVNNKSRKLYMLYELEPSREVTGGAWYTDAEFDAEFISALRQLCLTHIVKLGGDTLEGVVEAVRRAGSGGREDLRMEDFRQVISTLVFDRELDVFISTGSGKDSRFPVGAEVYRPSRSRAPESSAFTNIPCGVCPVINECSDGGIISPQTCVYFQQYLNF